MDKSKKVTVIGVIIIISLSIVSVSGFYTVFQSISALEQQKRNLENELNDVNDNLNAVNNQISNVNDEINQVVENLEENISELEMLESGDRYELHDPTYSEVVNFISSDKTDKKDHIENVFECRHYAREVNNNSEEQGIRCAYVVVNLSGPESHACVAFNTTDKGLLYYESQTDEKVNLETGKDYFADCVVIPGGAGYYYERNPDNIVEDFTLYW